MPPRVTPGGSPVGGSATSAPIGQSFYQVMNGDSEVNLFGVGDQEFSTSWGLTPSLTPFVLDFVFPDPWEGGTIVVNGTTFGGAAATQTFVPPDGGGRVQGDIVLFSVLTYGGSGGGDGDTTGHVQYGNAVCTPTKPIASFDLLLNGEYGGSISKVALVTPELTKGFVRVGSYASGDQLTLYYTSRPIITLS